MRITRRKLRSLIESVIREAQDALSSSKLSDADQKKIKQFLENNIDDYVEEKYPELLNLGYASTMNVINVSDPVIGGKGKIDRIGPEGSDWTRTTGSPSGDKIGFANIGDDLVFDVKIDMQDLKDGRGRYLLDDRDAPKFLDDLSAKIDGLTLKLAGGSVSFDTIHKIYNDYPSGSVHDEAELFLQVAVKYYKIR